MAIASTLDSKSINLKSSKLRRAGIIAGAIWIGISCAYLLFAAYQWTWGTEKGRKQLPMLEAELERIEIPSSDSIVGRFSNYKSTKAILGKTFSSPQNWQALRDFYIAEMQRMGWTHTESKKVLEWNRDLGGQLEHFKKGPYFAELFYHRPTPRDPWTYGFSISIKLPLFGERK